jgi:hypothetical protein
MNQDKIRGDGDPDDQVSPEIARIVKDGLNRVDAEVDWPIGNEVKNDLQEKREDEDPPEPQE